MAYKLAAFLLTIWATAASAAALSREQVDAIVTPAVTNGFCKGIVVGVIDASGRSVYSYGVTDDGGRAPDGKTLFEIGSVSKTFTSTLLAAMVTSGQVRLDQPVRDLLPPGTRVPEHAGVAITLQHLATHTSGLPRLPANLDVETIDDPYALYTTTMLYDALATETVGITPGTYHEYSNFGVGLLGQALAHKAGTSYEQLIVDTIATPLGMKDTRITLDANQTAHLAPGHIGANRVSNWQFTDALAGAGAIRSTADDMLIYVAANLGLVDTPLAAAMKLTHEPRFKVDDGTDIGLGWFIGKRTGARWHNGQTLGYHSFIGFIPEKKIGVVVLTNSGGGTIDTLGTQLLWAALGNKVEPLPTFTTRRAATPSTRTTSWTSPTP